MSAPLIILLVALAVFVIGLAVYLLTRRQSDALRRKLEGYQGEAVAAAQQTGEDVAAADVAAQTAHRLADDARADAITVAQPPSEPELIAEANTAAQDAVRHATDADSAVKTGAEAVGLTRKIAADLRAIQAATQRAVDNAARQVQEAQQARQQAAEARRAAEAAAQAAAAARTAAGEALSRKLPPRAVAVTSRLDWGGAPRIKRLALVLIGTYGVREGEKLIERFRLADCDDLIGGVLAVDLDEARSMDLKTRLPDELSRRSVFCDTVTLPGGLQGQTIDEVEAAAIKQRWEPAVWDSVEEFCLSLRRTEFGEYTPGDEHRQQGYDPAVILVIASPGGHAALGIYVSKRMHEQFRWASTYVVSILSDNDFMRRQLTKGLDRYRQEQYVRWFMVTDNKRNPDTNDQAVARYFAGLWASSMTDYGKDSPWNTLKWLHPDGLGGVVTPRYWSRPIPVLRTTGSEPRYYSFEDTVYDTVLEGINAIEQQQYQCAGLTTPAPETMRYVIVTAPLTLPFLTRVKDRVERALKGSNWFDPVHQRQLIWAPTTEKIGRTTTGIDVSVVMVEAAPDGFEQLQRLATPPSGPPASPQDTHQNGVQPAIQDISTIETIPNPVPPNPLPAPPNDAPARAAENGNEPPATQASSDGSAQPESAPPSSMQAHADGVPSPGIDGVNGGNEASDS